MEKTQIEKKSESVRERKVIENFNKTQTSKKSQKKQQKREKLKLHLNCPFDTTIKFSKG